MIFFNIERKKNIELVIIAMKANMRKENSVTIYLKQYF